MQNTRMLYLAVEAGNFIVRVVKLLPEEKAKVFLAEIAQVVTKYLDVYEAKLDLITKEIK